jgi:hypothetical protein
VNPPSNGSSGFGEVAEIVLPNTLLFKAAKEALDHAILLGRIGRDELLAQAIIAARGAKAPALKDQTIIAAHHRGRTIRTQGTEACQAGLLERPLGFLSATAQCELKAHDLAVVTVNHRGEMTPAVSSAGDVGQVHGPPFIAPLGTALKSLNSRPRRHRTLMDEPTLEPKHSVHSLAVDLDPLGEAQHRPQPPITKARMPLDQALDAFG